MNEKFFELDLEKQNRILNAVMKEFAEKGYDRASTNEMVKEADISKGLLFHYFKNKKALYFYVFHYSVSVMENQIYPAIDVHERDYFIKIKELSKVKLQVIQRYPQLFKFLECAYLETSLAVKEELEKDLEQLSLKVMSQVFHNIDLTKFREDIDFEKVMKLVNWTMEGLYHDYLKKGSFQYEDVFKESESYLNLLQRMVYK